MTLKLGLGFILGEMGRYVKETLPTGTCADTIPKNRPPITGIMCGLQSVPNAESQVDSQGEAQAQTGEV